MDLNNIKKVNGKYVESNEVDISVLQVELADLEDTKTGVLARMQDDISTANAQIDAIDAKITKINTLLQ